MTDLPPAPQPRHSAANRAYQPYWCEENIWYLCQEAQFAIRKQLVVVITGHHAHFAIWNQRAAPPMTPMTWDYHVILLVKEQEWTVWDLDTRLPCPLAATEYLTRSFPAPHRVPVDLHPRFRILPAQQYVAHLSSDRSHMRRADGTFQKPPPAWPPPGAGTTPNLARFRDFSDPFLGERLDLAGLRLRLTAD